MNEEKLENALCFKIYSASRMLTRLYKPILDRFNLTFPQYITMMALWDNDNISFKELRKKLMLETGTLTPLIKKLEVMGHLKRVRDTVDERNVFIALSENGKKLKEETKVVSQEILEKIGISYDEYHEFLKDTETLFTVLNKAEDRY